MNYYLCIFPADTTQKHTLEIAYTEYAKAHGWRLGSQSKLLGTNSLTLMGNNILQLGSDDQEQRIKDAIRVLGPGDNLVVPSLSTLSIRPSIQEKIVQSLIARGVVVHLLNLGPVLAHWAGIAEGLNSGKLLEQAVDAKEKQLVAREAQMEADMAADRNKLFHRMIDEFGADKLVSRMQQNIGA